MYEEDDGVHPIAAGYDVVAEHIFAWSAWRDWFGAVDRKPQVPSKN